MPDKLEEKKLSPLSAPKVSENQGFRCKAIKGINLITQATNPASYEAETHSKP